MSRAGETPLPMRYRRGGWYREYPEPSKSMDTLHDIAARFIVGVVWPGEHAKTLRRFKSPKWFLVRLLAKALVLSIRPIDPDQMPERHARFIAEHPDWQGGNHEARHGMYFHLGLKPESDLPRPTDPLAGPYSKASKPGG